MYHVAEATDSKYLLAWFLIRRRRGDYISDLTKRWDSLSEKRCWCPSVLSVTRTITLVVIGLLLWSVFYFEFGEDILPGSQMFSLLVLFISSYVAGCLIELIKLPALLGMLLMGMI